MAISTVTLYHKNGSSMKVPSGDVSYWNNQGWATSKPSISTTNSIPVSTTNYAPVPRTSNQKISRLYNDYFGRSPSSQEYAYWSTQKEEVFKKQLNDDYERATKHDYDGSPVLSGNEYSKKDKERIDTLFSKYEYSPSKPDYNYWSNPNKSNDVGNLEANLIKRQERDPDIETVDKNIYKKGKDLFTKKGDEYYKISNTDELKDLVNNQNYTDNRIELPSNAPISETIIETSETPIKDIDETPTTIIDSEKYDRAFFMDPDSGSFIQFSSDPDQNGPFTEKTIWYVDPTGKNLRPIISEEAYNNSFEEPLGELMNRGGISTVPISFLNEGKPLAGFTMLSSKYGFQNDGKYINPPTTIDQEKINMRYGKELDETGQYDVFRENVAGFLRWLKENPDSGISATTIDEISSDPEVLALYTSALTYGGYKQSDIYKDVKRRELINNGNTALSGVKVIDESVNATNHYNSGEWANVNSISSLNMPTTVGGIETSLLDNTYINLPTEVYDVFTSTVDWESSAGQAKIDEVKSAYHDILIKYLDAKTESAQAIAQESYDRFRSELSKKYNISLSDDATAAWDTINEIEKTFSAKGLGDAGMEREAMNKYLESVREKDTRLRDEKLTKEEDAKREYLLKNGTPEEIQALSSDERAKLGLSPKDTVNKDEWVSNFKEEYPNLESKDEYAEIYYNILYDKNGNYRSETFQTLMKNKFLIKEGVEFGNTLGGSDLIKFEKAYEKETEKVRKEEEDVLRKYKDVAKAIPIAETKDITGTINKVKLPTYPTEEVTPLKSTALAPAFKSDTSFSQKSTPTTSNINAFKTFTEGKNDILGSNWQGYTPISASDYDTEEKKKQYKNVQAVGGTLYGFKS